LNAYLFTYVSRQFGGAWLPREITPLEVNIPKPSEAEILSAVDIVQNAERPVLLLGSQAVLPPVKPHDLQKLVNVSQRLLTLTIILGTWHPYLFGRNVSRTFGQRLSCSTETKPQRRVEGGGCCYFGR
jgi:hypothetical protein